MFQPSSLKEKTPILRNFLSPLMDLTQIESSTKWTTTALHPFHRCLRDRFWPNRSCLSFHTLWESTLDCLAATGSSFTSLSPFILSSLRCFWIKNRSKSTIKFPNWSQTKTLLPLSNFSIQRFFLSRFITPLGMISLAGKCGLKTSKKMFPWILSLKKRLQRNLILTNMSLCLISPWSLMKVQKNMCLKKLPRAMKSLPNNWNSRQWVKLKQTWLKKLTVSFLSSKERAK